MNFSISLKAAVAVRATQYRPTQPNMRYAFLPFIFAILQAPAVLAGCTSGTCSSSGSGRFAYGISMTVGSSTYYCCRSNGKFCTTDSTESECPSPSSSPPPPPPPPPPTQCPTSHSLQTSECEFRIMDTMTKTVSTWVSMSDLLNNTLSSTGSSASGELKGTATTIWGNVCGYQQTFTRTKCYFTGGGGDRWYIQSRVKDCPSQVCYANGNVFDWYCDYESPSDAGVIYSNEDEWWSNDGRYNFSALDAYGDCSAPPPPPLPPPPALSPSDKLDVQTGTVLYRSSEPTGSGCATSNTACSCSLEYTVLKISSSKYQFTSNFDPSSEPSCASGYQCYVLEIEGTLNDDGSVLTGNAKQATQNIGVASFAVTGTDTYKTFVGSCTYTYSTTKPSVTSGASAISMTFLFIMIATLNVLVVP